MGRAKLRMELITKEKTRDTTYQKRKLGIIKKANEFTILCDVDTVIIIYPPNSNEPEIWPEKNHDDLYKTIALYKSKKGEIAKRTYDLNDFFQDRKKKIEDELLKARKKNMEAKYATWFDELNGLSDDQLRQFAMALEGKENLVRAHLLKKRNMNIHLPIYDLDLGLGPGHDYVQIFNRNNEFGWFNNDAMETSTSSMKFEQLMGPGYQPVFEGGVLYNNKLNQWTFQHGGLLQENFVMQELEGQVKNGSCYE